ncbi:MAG TPA: hypothetical protein ENJ06_06435 [Phycisphaeraceae bacterium]|nr:hypothetical protein [Phycisphaeraceae bacterium]
MTTPRIDISKEPAGSEDRDILDILQHQVELLTELENIAAEQEELVNPEAAVDLLRSMQRRQVIIDRLGRLSQQVQKCLPDEQAVQKLEAGKQQRFRELNTRFRELIKNVAQHDEKVRAGISNVRDRLAGQLGEVTFGQGVMQTYGRAQRGGAATNRFTDREA